MTKELEKIRDFVVQNEKEQVSLQKPWRARPLKFKLVGDEIYSDDDKVYSDDYSGDCEDN